MLAFLGAVGAIILVDLALSGDNALIIGAAASGLEPRQRTWAIVAGGGAAIVLRVALAIAATLLLNIPLLEAIGGVILVVIATRLLWGAVQNPHVVASSETETAGASGKPKSSFVAALLTILVADITMSLDNILAVGGLAHGNIPVLAIGLFFSVAILLVGSAIVAGLIGRLPWLLDLAALVLGWTAGSMIHSDTIVGPRLNGFIDPYLGGIPFASYAIPVVGALVVLLLDVTIRVWSRHAHLQPATAPAPSAPEPGEHVESR